MRERMNESERDYVRSQILAPLRESADKLHLFGTLERASNVMVNSIDSLEYETETYEIKLDIKTQPEDNKVWFNISGRPKDCDESLTYSRCLQFTGN